MDSTGQNHVLRLDVSQSWALLRQAEVGRLAVVVDNEPDIFPINFIVDHGSIVFRTSEGTKLAAAAGRSVAFEVDGFDSVSGEAWSVVVKGRARLIEQMHELIDSFDLPVFPWHAGPKPRFVRIDPAPDGLTGLRFRKVDASTWRVPAPGFRRAPAE